jgi:tRNA-dihydrouridine synthase
LTHINVVLSSQHATIPVIANGLSSNNRNSDVNTYDGIRSKWRETGADSIMIARGAEWNPAIFSQQKEKIGVMEVKHETLLIHYILPYLQNTNCRR